MDDKDCEIFSQCKHVQEQIARIEQEKTEARKEARIAFLAVELLLFVCLVVVCALVWDGP
jgi:hypothetical protein